MGEHRDSNRLLRILATWRTRSRLRSPFNISRGFTLWIRQPGIFESLVRIETYGTLIPILVRNEFDAKKRPDRQARHLVVAQ
jgi:hypothetical protein